MLTAEQLETRRQGIGGSDAAAAVGLHPYKTMLELYLEKTGDLQPPDLSDNERVHFGNVLEEVVAQEYSRRTGKRVIRRNATITHKQHPFMLAHVDRLVVGESRILECKTADRYTQHLWGEEGTDQVPDHYMIQCLHYMAVLDRDACDLAVLIGGNEFRTYTINRDHDLEQQLIDQEAAFWRRVELGNPPGPSTSEDLSLLFPRDTGASVLADEPTLIHVEQLRALKTTLAELEQQKIDLENKIKTFIGDNAAVVDDENNIIASWKTTTSNRLDSKRLKADKPELYEQYATTQSTRRFLVRSPKND